LPGPKLGYDISALPGRQRFHIADQGKAVTPATGRQALDYYAVGKKAGAKIDGLSARNDSHDRGNGGGRRI